MGVLVNADGFDAMRKAMVESQLRPSGVNDPRVIAAMAVVPREAFLPRERRLLAYNDRPLGLGDGREMNSPTVTGRLLTELQLASDDRVLLIGAGGGYAAALLSLLAAEVVALEVDSRLASLARDGLAAAGYDGPDIVEGLLAEGYSAGAPYDAILVDGAVERVPDALVDQLVDGGRLAAVLLENGVGRLIIGRKAGTGFGFTAFEDGDAPHLPGFATAKTFAF